MTCGRKGALYKREKSVWLHLHKVLKQVKPIYDGKYQNGGCLQRWEWRTHGEHKGTFWDHRNVLYLGRGLDCKNSVNTHLKFVNFILYKSKKSVNKYPAVVSNIHADVYKRNLINIGNLLWNASEKKDRLLNG